jgi:hypothetical protein
MSPTVARSAARLAVVAALLLPTTLGAQVQKPDSQPAVPAAKPDSQPKAVAPKKWYDRILIRGYAQVRYNRIFADNPEYYCPACDRSVAFPGGISLRRARLVVQGGLSDQVQVKLETDLVVTVGNDFSFLQLRELYGDVFVDKAHTGQARLGLAKVPYGFENLQSSSIRLPFDRSDAISSGSPGERDLGLFAIWGTAPARKELRALVDSGYKGEGDFGIVMVGVYNGQSINRAELNDNKTIGARVSYPFRLPHHQILELGVSGFTGQYVLPGFLRTPNIVGEEDQDYLDQRVAISMLLAPMPFGLQAEWTWGKGPSYDAGTNTVSDKPLNGGYVMAMYRANVAHRLFFPYARWQYYDGGKKNELDARYYLIKETEIGIQCAVLRGLTMTAAYMFGDRTFEDALVRENHQKGSTMRLQAQFNY